MNPRYKTMRRTQIEPLIEGLSVEAMRLRSAFFSPLTYAEIGDRGLGILKAQSDEIYSDIQSLREELCHLTNE